MVPPLPCNWVFLQFTWNVTAEQQLSQLEKNSSFSALCLVQFSTHYCGVPPSSHVYVNCLLGVEGGPQLGNSWIAAGQQLASSRETVYWQLSDISLAVGQGRAAADKQLASSWETDASRWETACHQLGNSLLSVCPSNQLVSRWATANLQLASSCATAGC